MSALNCRIVQTQLTPKVGRSTEERLQEQIEYQQKELGRLRQAALRDPVTGGANMRCLAMAYDWMEDGDPVSMLYVDIDGFRKVNDAIGRDGGDAVLTAIHNELERCLRWDDVVAREGADCFVALLPLAIKEDAQAVAERLRASIEKMVFKSAQGRFRLTVKVGCSTRHNRDDLNVVITRADQAARRGGRHGGNMVCAS